MRLFPSLATTPSLISFDMTLVNWRLLIPRASENSVPVLREPSATRSTMRDSRLLGTSTCSSTNGSGASSNRRNVTVKLRPSV